MWIKTISHPGWFVSFPCLIITRSRTASTALKRSFEKSYPCLNPNLRGEALCHSLLNTIFPVNFLYVFFTSLKKFPSIPGWLRVFIRNTCWTLSNAFLEKAFTELILCFTFLFVNMVNYNEWLSNAKQLYSGTNPTYPFYYFPITVVTNGHKCSEGQKS